MPRQNLSADIEGRTNEKDQEKLVYSVRILPLADFGYTNNYGEMCH